MVKFMNGPNYGKALLSCECSLLFISLNKLSSLICQSSQCVGIISKVGYEHSEKLPNQGKIVYILAAGRLALANLVLSRSSLERVPHPSRGIWSQSTQLWCCHRNTLIYVEWNLLPLFLVTLIGDRGCKIASYLKRLCNKFQIHSWAQTCVLLESHTTGYLESIVVWRWISLSYGMMSMLDICMWSIARRNKW